MSWLRVGQKVKKVMGMDAGNTGVITGLDVGRRWDVCVAWDNAGPYIGGVGRPGEEVWTQSHSLEPITPPHVAGSWEVIEQLLPNIREGVAA